MNMGSNVLNCYVLQAVDDELLKQLVNVGSNVLNCYVLQAVDDELMKQ